MDSPFATALAAASGPEGLIAQQAARKVLGAVTKGSNLANQASTLTDRSTYTSGKGLANSLENLEDARKRVADVHGAATGRSFAERFY